MAEKQDIPMNNFTQAADASFVYGELADGSQVKLRIGDIANVITNIIVNKNILATLIGYSLPSGVTTINDIITPGVWIVSGNNTAGLSGYSGVLVNFGGQQAVTGQLLITKDCLAFRRNDSSWNKVSFATVG